MSTTRRSKCAVVSLFVMALLVAGVGGGCAKPVVQGQGTGGQVQAAWYLGRLEAKVGPEVGVPTVRAAAEQTLRSRGYTIESSTGTRDAFRVVAWGMSDRRRERTEITGALTASGTKIAIEPEDVSSAGETTARAVLDEVLRRLGR